MGYFQNVLQSNEKIDKIGKTSSTFVVSYNFWIENLFERAMRLFKWNNTEIEQKLIESIILSNGFSVISKNKKGELVSTFGSLFGVTEYFNEFNKVSIYTPLWTAEKTIDTDCVVINNNAVRNSIYPLLHRYATLLGHCEVTLTNVLINMRQNGVPTVSNEKQKQQVISYRNSLCNGKLMPILDPAFIGVEWKNTTDGKNLSVQELFELRENLLNAFYNDIGVKTTWNKKGNMIADEVGGNDNMLLFNIDDMLHERQIACEKVNAMFGTNWTVEKSKELNYTQGGSGNDNDM